MVGRRSALLEGEGVPPLIALVVDGAGFIIFGDFQRDAAGRQASRQAGRGGSERRKEGGRGGRQE